MRLEPRPDPARFADVIFDPVDTHRWSYWLRPWSLFNTTVALVLARIPRSISDHAMRWQYREPTGSGRLPCDRIAPGILADAASDFRVYVHWVPSSRILCLVVRSGLIYVGR